MKIMNYMNLNQHPVQLSFLKDRSYEFEEIYHAHQGMELLYVHNGSGHIISEGVMSEIRQGSLFCFRPFHMHRVKIDVKEGPYIRSLFVFEPSAILKYIEPFQSLQHFFHELWKQPMAQTVFTDIPEEKLKCLIEDHEKEIHTLNSADRFELEAYFILSLLRLLRLHASKSGISAGPKPIARVSNAITLILDWLESHYHEEFRLEALAVAVHLSPNHVSYIFHKETGTSISDYLAARRIQESCTLLRTSALNIQEIGYRVGFSNFSYFCKFFKKHTGLTPHKFRQLQA